MRVLLIWEEIPEQTRLFVIEDAPEWLPKVHGYHINVNAAGEQEKLLLRVSDALCPDEEYCANPDDELATTWAANEVGRDKPFVVEAQSVVVVCGFAC